MLNVLFFKFNINNIIINVFDKFNLAIKLRIRSGKDFSLRHR